jgi:hypothetical protein
LSPKGWQRRQHGGIAPRDDGAARMIIPPRGVRVWSATRQQWRRYFDMQGNRQND